ncbi:MAG TPA: ChaN family lipoprotein [Burkholderiaceae bacterium]|jgi:uncharacterized iron-regulated protein
MSPPRCRIAPLLVATALLAACAQPPAPATPPMPIELQRLNEALRTHPIVLFGEVHDNAAQHALRAQALRTLLDSGARPALAMEQFDRERQPELDRALARPGVTVDEVIAAGSADGRPMRGWSWPLYRPYIALAIEYHLALVAANVSRADAMHVIEDGLAAQGFDARVPADIAAAQTSAIVDGHCGMLDAAQAGTMVSAQAARDQFMARVIEAHAANGIVLLAGDGHVRRDIGVPRWLSAQTRARSVSIGLLEGGDAAQAAAFDLTLATPAQPREDPCDAMLRAASAPRS